MSRADKFFDMSTRLPKDEMADERNELSLPELRHVAELRDTGAVGDAINYAQSLQKMYPDFDLIPFMIAYVQYQDGKPEKAIQTALDAIPDCKRKYRLYSVAGLAEYSKDNLANALVWWSRSAIAQAQVADFQEFDPFLYLGYASEGIGQQEHAQTMYTMVAAIDPDAPQDDEARADIMAQMKTLWARKPFKRVMDVITRQHLS